MFKSAEEREAERREKEAADAQAVLAREEQARVAAEAKAAAAYAASPAGLAVAAKRAEERYFEIQLEVGAHRGTASFGSVSGDWQPGSSARVLADIEKAGWALQHAGYFYMLTGESSTQQIFGSGQNTAMSGTTVGVYLFRNTDSP